MDTGSPFLPYDADLLALVFLRADPAAYGRKSVRLLELARRLDELALGYEAYEPRYVDVNRASADAQGLLALDAPLRLGYRLLRGIAVPGPRRSSLPSHALGPARTSSAWVSSIFFISFASIPGCLCSKNR